MALTLEDVLGTRTPFSPWSQGAPKGWDVVRTPEWETWFPLDKDLPEQGWKIHTSTVPGEAQDALEVVATTCLSRHVAFKFVPTHESLAVKASKNSPRSAAGKFTCIYPDDEQQCGQIVSELLTALEGMHGPDILTDLRCGPAPVFVRWGAFLPLYTTDPQSPGLLAVRGPDGKLVPDDRRHGLRVPDWVSWPAWTQAARHERLSQPSRLPCSLTRPLALHAGGGVYEATMHSDGTTVVVKEGRPHAGLDVLGHDSAWRVRHEASVLRRLAGNARVPRLIEQVEGARHSYLVREKIEGTTLRAARLEQRRTLSTVAYDAWARDVLAALRHEIDAVHSCGLVINDLHENNVLLDGSGVVLFDLEAVSDTSSTQPQAMAALDCAAPSGVHGVDADRFAYNVMVLGMFLRSVRGVRLGAQRVRALAGQAVRAHPDCADLITSATAELLNLLSTSTASGTTPSTVREAARANTLGAAPEALTETAPEAPTALLTNTVKEEVTRLKTLCVPVGTVPPNARDLLTCLLRATVPGPGLPDGLPLLGDRTSALRACLGHAVGTTSAQEARAALDAVDTARTTPGPAPRPGLREGRTGDALLHLVAQLTGLMPDAGPVADLLARDAEPLTRRASPVMGGIDGRLAWHLVTEALETLTPARLACVQGTVPLDLLSSSGASGLRGGAIGTLALLAALRALGHPRPEAEAEACSALADSLLARADEPAVVGVVDDLGLNLAPQGPDGSAGASRALALVQLTNQ